MEPILIKFVSKTVHLTKKVEIKQYKANKNNNCQKPTSIFIGEITLHWFIDEKQVFRNVSDMQVIMFDLIVKPKTVLINLKKKNGITNLNIFCS